ncbi:uncharacterized protein LOC143342818 [Colletes latitarsis]|uniref:uncharacterized protein LOC143342818 n=1 Tax=Colletes latitarsis TaxID=2605962 RepID=UPI0040363F4E
MKHSNCWNNTSEICEKFMFVPTNIRNPMFVIEYEYILTKFTPEDKYKNLTALHTLNDTLCVCLSTFNITQYIDVDEKVEVYNLVKICISGQNINSIDIDLELPNLREFDISFNHLKEFPNSKFMKNIKILNISYNNIQHIYIQESLLALEELDISWNCLTHCLTSIKTFKTFIPNMYKLKICNNPFKDITDPGLEESLIHVYLPNLQFINNYESENLNLSENYFSCAFNMCKLKQCNKLIYLNQNIMKSSKEIALIKKNSIEYVKYIHIYQDFTVALSISKKALKIQELCATCCSLITFPIVKPLKYLTKLNLGSNFISVLDDFTQENFPTLKYLDLTNNLITSLEPMGSFYTLQEFYCGNNDIRTLIQIDNVKTWHTLHVIDLSNNPIIMDALYKKFIIFHLNNIKYISGEYVQNSEISEAKQIFGNKLDKYVLNTLYRKDRLINITQLSITDCSLSKVDLSAELLPQLESLDLSRNQITYLWGLYSFPYLHTLCLSYNCLETLDGNGFEKSNCTFSKLYTLFLDHNCIKSIMNLSKKLPVIKHLFLNNNYLQNISGINHCSTLESLFLDYNEISTLNKDDFIENNNLKVLSLENNKIKSLEFIKVLQKLQKLYAANNCLTNEHEIQYLSLLNNLEELTFEGNSLYTEVNKSEMILQNFELKQPEEEEL